MVDGSIRTAARVVAGGASVRIADGVAQLTNGKYAAPAAPGSALMNTVMLSDAIAYGDVNGTPTAAVPFNYTLNVIDSGDLRQSASQQFFGSIAAHISITAIIYWRTRLTKRIFFATESISVN